MRRASKVDANQATIVGGLRGYGCSVQHLHSVGAGCPDLLVGFRGSNFLLEVKDGDKPPSARELNADQKVWHASWRGQASVVKNLSEAMHAVGLREVKEIPVKGVVIDERVMKS